MPDPKITFGPDYQPQEVSDLSPQGEAKILSAMYEHERDKLKPSTAAVDLTVIAEEIRKSFSLGFDKAIEFYRTVTTPPPAQATPASSIVSLGGDDDEFGPNVLDLNTVYTMGPEAQEAILSRHGLTWRHPEKKEFDPTHSVVAGLTKNEAPPGVESEE